MNTLESLDHDWYPGNKMEMLGPPHVQYRIFDIVLSNISIYKSNISLLLFFRLIVTGILPFSILCFLNVQIVKVSLASSEDNYSGKVTEKKIFHIVNKL